MRTRIAVAIAAALLTACTAAPPATPSASPTVTPVAQVAATPLPSGRGTWTADAGIYGTDFHYGLPAYLCGVGYNLSYGGGAPLISVDVAVRFPDAFAAHVAGSSIDRAIGWQHPTMQISSPSQIHDAAWLSRLGDAIGAVCQNGAADLDSLRGTILRVNWETIEGSYEAEFEIDEVRGQMTACGTPDGRIHISWTDPSPAC